MPIKYTAEHWDRVRDYRKHEPRPGEPDYIPLHAQSARVAGALEVAILAKAAPLQMAADLIEQYARTKASEAKLDGVTACADRVFAALENSDAEA